MKRILSTFLVLFSLSTQAGLPPTSLSGLNSATKPTTFTFKAPYSQATQISGIESLIETGSENMLVNPGFEGGATAGVANGWTNVSGTASVTTTSSEITSGKKAQKIVLSANSLGLIQEVLTPTGIQKQGVVGIAYATTVSSFQVCARVDSDAARDICIPSANLILDGLYHTVEIPFVFGSVSAGIYIKSASATGTVLLDAAYIKQGLGTQNLMTDYLYGARVTTTSGAVAGQTTGKELISSCTSTGTNNTVCTFASGRFTQDPICTLGLNNGAGSVALFSISSKSASGFTLTSIDSRTAASLNTQTTEITCQKSGNDYLASSANVYSAASANTNPTLYTPTYTGGSSFSDEGTYFHRDGKFLNVRGVAVITIPSASALSISLPSGLLLDASSMSSTTNANSAGVAYGVSGSVANAYPTAARGPFVVFTDTAVSSSVVYLSNATNGSRFDKSAGNVMFSSGDRIRFEFRVPISGWSNSNVIVGSFAELGIKNQTPSNTTSGTSVDYSIPVNAKKVTLMLNGVSTNGTSNLLVQLSANSTIQTTGYLGAVAYHGASNSVLGTNITTGCSIFSDAAVDVTHGSLVLNLLDSSSGSWVGSSVVAHSNENYTGTSGCSKTLSGALDRIRLTTTNGTDVFDAGTVNVSVEY